MSLARLSVAVALLIALAVCGCHPESRMAGGPLVGLAVGLQTVAQLVEQVGHYLVADAVA